MKLNVITDVSMNLLQVYFCYIFYKDQKLKTNQKTIIILQIIL